jgi:hypothetical protein
MLGSSLFPGNQFTSILQNPISSLLRCIGLSVIFALVIAIFYHFLVLLSRHCTSLTSRNNRPTHLFMAASVLMFLSWIPCLLGYFPGIAAYDAPMQTQWALHSLSQWSQHHPVIHTFLWSLFLRLGQAVHHPTLSITAYALTQMAVMAGIGGYLCYWLYTRLHSRLCALFAFIFWSFCPMIALMNLIMVKDVLFGGLWLLLSLRILDLRNKNTSYFKAAPLSWLSLGILFLLTMLFRNNAPYVLVLLMFFLCFRLYPQNKSYFRSALLLFTSCIFLFVLITKLLFPALSIQNGSVREMLSVPIMQLVGTAKAYQAEIPPDEWEELDRYIPLDQALSVYNPRFADPVKNLMVDQEDLTSFFNLWRRWLIRYPGKYMEIFMSLHLPYWFINAKVPDAYSARRYIETTSEGDYSIPRTSLLPVAYDYYEKTISVLTQTPLLRNLFGTAMPFFFLTFGCWTSLWKKDADSLLLFFFHGLLLATYFLGPVDNFRYIYPMFLCYPLYIAFIFKPKMNK